VACVASRPVGVSKEAAELCQRPPRTHVVMGWFSSEYYIDDMQVPRVSVPVRWFLPSFVLELSAPAAAAPAPGHSPRRILQHQ